MMIFNITTPDPIPLGIVIKRSNDVIESTVFHNDSVRINGFYAIIDHRKGAVRDGNVGCLVERNSAFNAWKRGVSEGTNSLEGQPLDMYMLNRR